MAKIAPKYRSSQLTDDFINQAKNNGLVYEAFITKKHASIILDKLVDGSFADPNDFLQFILNEYFEYATHDDLRKEVLNRQIQKSIESTEPKVSSANIFAKLREQLNQPKPQPAEWKKDKTVFEAFCNEDGFIYDESDNNYQVENASIYKDIQYDSFLIDRNQLSLYQKNMLDDYYLHGTVWYKMNIGIVPLHLITYRGNEVFSKYYFCLNCTKADVILLFPKGSSQSDIDSVYSHLGIKK